MNTNAQKWLLLLVLWLALGTFLCWKYLCKEDKVVVDESFVQQTKPLIWNLSVGDLKQTANGYPRFLTSSSKLILPYLEDVDRVNFSVGEYLKAIKQKELNIVGYYKMDETNDNNFYENLGLARANSIKNSLVAAGIPSNQITTTSQLLDSIYFVHDTLMMGCDYTFLNMDIDIAKLSELKSVLRANPIILYFQTNSNEPELSAAQRHQFADLLYYLDNVPAAKINISGHTDDVGDNVANVSLSKERAEFVSNYLQAKANFSTERINVKGMGAIRPLEKNDTDESKAKNRRVEVVLE